MKEPTLIVELHARNIQFRVDGDELQLDAPAGALTPELLELLRRQKAEILAFLRGPSELSFAQRRLWFLDQVEMASTAYMIPHAVRLEGALHVAALEGALASLVARHESLRTTFADVDGRPVQIVSEVASFSLPVVEAGAEPGRLAELMREEMHRGFDLARGPLFRAVLYRLGPEEHVLLLLQHHIISDAWSVDVMMRELGTLYRDRVSGRGSVLPELPLQYRDFARWQREWLKDEALTHQLEYWRTHLAGAPQALDLPTDRPRPPMESHRGANYTFAIPREVSEGLAVLSRREGTTLFMALMAAFDVLLWRYTGQEDLLVGMPVANRGRKELEGLIGVFVNTLVVRNDLSGDPTVQEMLARVRERCLDAYAHQELPLEMLVRDLQPARDLSRNPLFQVMLNLQSAAGQPFAVPGLIVTPVEADRGATHVDLTLYVQETPEGLAGGFEHATDLFDKTTIERMARHWCALLEAMIAAPGRRISELPLLSDAEREELQVDWNRTVRDYPRESLLQGLFEAQAVRAPGRTALVVGEEAVSYGELDARACRMAQALRARGVGRGERVGLCVERGADMLACVLGILKAGAAYVPLDPMFPAERLRFMAEDAQLALLVSTSALAGVFGLPRERQLLLDADAAVIASQPDRRLGPDAALDARPGDPAYLIYTSGSTGKPKGVVVPHRAVVNFLASMAREPGLGADDVLVAVTTLSFDIAVLELQLPLTLGATVVIASRDEAVDGHALGALLERHRATVMQATPVTWRLLLAAGWSAKPGFKALVGGEALPRDLAEQLIARGVELWNMYGPTETTVWSTCARITDPANGISIGKPIANTTVYILDGQKNLCPIGVPGELCIGGEGVTLGYWNRPELTAERFIPDPFSTTPGARLYRTGDRARWRNEGTLEHLGRLDFQVKIRGYRIELGEIEAAIARHGAVKEAVVIVREDDPGDLRLVAYLVVGDPPEDLVDQLRAQLRATLPEYMVPSAYVVLEALPLTANGKIDRKALPALTQEFAKPDRKFVAPRTPIEEVVAGIWADVLKLDRVDVQDNFFDLGGHSFLAIQVIFALRQALEVELPLASFFESPTVAGMAAAVMRLQASHALRGVRDGEPNTDGKSGGSATALPRIVPAPLDKHLPFPLTDVQQAYWVGRSGTFELGNVATHVYVEYDCADLDLARLEHAWQEMIKRHDMLRAIVLPDGQQQILENVPPYSIEVLDLRGRNPREIATQLEGVRRQLSHQVAKSDRWPLFELRASRMDEGLVRLHFSRDVLMVDGWSAAIVQRELCELYQQPGAVLPPIEISFRDYVLAEAAIRGTDLYRRSQDYWWARLATLPPAPELPLAKDPSQVVTQQFTRRSTRYEPTTWKALKSRAARAGLTTSVLLLAAFADVLKVWSKSPRFTINLTLFNRLPLHPQVNDLVGDMTSLTLLAVDGSAEGGFAARAQHLQRQLWNDLDHRFVSGVEIMRELARRQRNMRGAAMPVVFTSVIGQQSSDPPSAPLDNEVYAITQTPQVWLDPQIYEDDGALVVAWDAVEELFPEGLLDDMFGSYCRSLQRLSEDETAWQESWPETARQLLPAKQLEQRAAVNDTAAPITDDLLHTLFAKQVPQRRQQAAVISTDRTLTYEELYRCANRIGHWLRDNGAQRNTLVAVVMEKGWEQVAGVLGVLASGAAYLPIDASLPKERLWHLLQHGEVQFVLTQSQFDKSLEWPASIERLTLDDSSLSRLDDKPLDPVQAPEDLAYVIYTSGSTGLPKGVMIDHRGAVNTILDLNRRFGVKGEDRILALSSLSFDLSVYDIFGILAAGGTIVVPDAIGLRDPAHWTDLVAQHRVTLWNTVPALLQMLVEYTEGRGQQLARDLRLIFMSGDWIPVALPGEIRALNRSVEIISMGGATEASIWSIIYPIEVVDPSWNSIPYGRPMDNQAFHVLNDALEPCPVWVPGQLYIGGIGLAKGYWRDDEKTRASFIDHPRTTERLYRTGDLGRYLPDGNIEFMGRNDFQVKVQGYRVELGEIEATLSQHPSVRHAVVNATGNASGEKRLVAYIVPSDRWNAETAQGLGKSGEPFAMESDARSDANKMGPARHGEASSAGRGGASTLGGMPSQAQLELSTELRSFLRGKLPEYMVPAVFVYLDALPLSGNGKVDRAALPAPASTEMEADRSHAAPQTDLEQTVAGIWRDVLTLEAVGVDDNFFDIGGTSLHVVRVHNKLCQRLGRQISVTEIFQYPTISALAAHLGAERSRSPSLEKAHDIAKRQRESMSRQRERGRNRSK